MLKFDETRKIVIACDKDVVECVIPNGVTSF